MKKVFAALFLFNCLFIFPNDFNERKNKFVSEGFGFKYDLREYHSRTLFLENHGKPIQIIEQIIINRHNGLEDKIITLEYNSLIVTFYEWNEKAEGHFPESMLLSITSKDNNEYLFGIRHGMEINNLIEIFGELDASGNSIWLAGYTGNVATIVLENNKVKYIVWNYSLE